MDICQTAIALTNLQNATGFHFIVIMFLYSLPSFQDWQVLACFFYSKYWFFSFLQPTLA